MILREKELLKLSPKRVNPIWRTMRLFNAWIYIGFDVKTINSNTAKESF